MKVIHEICCGIDVHKTFLVATIVTATDTRHLTYKKDHFSTFNKDLRRLKKWLIQNNCYDVCMESTGKYWVPVLNVLEPELRVMVVNPKWVSAIKGNKDDVKDSKWIAELFCFGIPYGIFIPEKPIRILREFTRYRYKLTNMRSSEKNRFQNGFTVCNIALDSVVSDMFGKSASAITDYLLNAPAPDPEHCRGLLYRSLKKKADAVVNSIEGFQLTEEQAWRMLQVRKHLEYLENDIAEVDAKIDELVRPYEPAIKFLRTIPGMRRESAITVI
ncbi:MAG: transposase [Selenomonadaceae bacterium]